MSGKEYLIRELEALGISRVTDPGTRQMKFQVKCDCGETLEKSYKANMHPDGASKFIARAGWKISKKHSPICPGCQKKEKQTVAAKTDQVPSKSIKDIAENSVTRFAAVSQALAAVDVTSPVKAGTSTIEINPKIARQVYGLLEQHFDEANGKYAKGWSDHRIGKDLDVAETAVAKIRTEAYGEIRVDPVLVALQDEVKYIDTRISQIEEKTLNDLTKQIEPLRTNLASITARLNAYDA